MAKKLTKELFEKRAKEVHGDRYDYSKVVYVNGSVPIIISCPIHKDFMQRPDSHLKGLGCRQCGIEQRVKNVTITTEEFITKAQTIHNDRYDYSLVTYTGIKSKVQIICKVHGLFDQIAGNHLQGKGCSNCGRQRTTAARPKQLMKRNQVKNHTTESFINTAIKKYGPQFTYESTKFEGLNIPLTITCNEHGNFKVKPYLFLYKNTHCNTCKLKQTKPKFTAEFFIKTGTQIHNGRYDYSESVFVSITVPISIKCKIHGEFKQIPKLHLHGAGCTKCSHSIRSKKQITPFEKFVEQANIVHNNKYEYKQESYRSVTNKLTIICPEHGQFTQQGASHLRGNGCCDCTSHISKPEVRWLNLLNIPNDKEHRQPMFFFNKIRYKPDGFDPNTNTIYEFLGDFWHGNLNRFDSNDLNKINKKTFQQLNDKTFERFELFKSQGFKVVYIWESDFLKYEKWAKEKDLDLI